MPNKRVEALFEEVLGLPSGQRTRFLDALSRKDPRAYAELGPLLQAHEAAGNFLQGPPPGPELARQFLDQEFAPFRVSRYLVLEPIGAGGMAKVYRAISLGPAGFEKSFAIKQSHTSDGLSAETSELFEYEAQLGSRLNHANIVQVHEFLRSGNSQYLVMEYVEGKNLAQIISRVSESQAILPLPFTIQIAREVCKGLAYAHHKRENIGGTPLHIVHRDLSPQNIMVSYEGAVKIVDFGIAKGKDRMDVTQRGMLRGKPTYFSPEQAAGLPIDYRSDIFSLGIVLHELLSGERLFLTDDILVTLTRIRQCEIPSLRSRNPKVPPALEEAVTRALSKDPNDRYQDIAEFQRRLEQVLATAYPGFESGEVARIMQKLFAAEIARESEKSRGDESARRLLAAGEESLESSPESFPGGERGKTIQVQTKPRMQSGNGARPKPGRGPSYWHTSLTFLSLIISCLVALMVVERKELRLQEDDPLKEPPPVLAPSRPPEAAVTTKTSLPNGSTPHLTLSFPPNGDRFTTPRALLARGFVWQGPDVSRNASTFYQLELGQNPELIGGMMVLKSNRPSIQKPDISLKPGDYYWRVRLVETGGKSIAVSEVFSFTYAHPPRKKASTQPLPLPPPESEIDLPTP